MLCLLPRASACSCAGPRGGRAPGSMHVPSVREERTAIDGSQGQREQSRRKDSAARETDTRHRHVPRGWRLGAGSLQRRAQCGELCTYLHRQSGTARPRLTVHTVTLGSLSTRSRPPTESRCRYCTSAERERKSCLHRPAAKCSLGSRV